MAYAQPARSCLRELDEGMVKGAYKQVVQDRGGIIDPATWECRQDLSVKLYGIAEAPVKVLPDTAGEVVTPYSVPTPDPERMGY